MMLLGVSPALAQGAGPAGRGPMMGQERGMPHAAMQGGAMPHAMMAGGNCPMMEGVAGGAMGPASGPKAQARMLKMRGDMMKAMGGVMLKHADGMEKET